MRGITHPIHFENIESMDQFYSEFEVKAIEICKKYKVPELWTIAKIYKDDASLALSIISLGAHIEGSNEEKAANEIINVFNDI